MLIPILRVFGRLRLACACLLAVVIVLLPTVPSAQTDWTRARLLERRNWTAAAYDVARQRVVMFGGWGPAQLLLNDTWEWDGSSWIQRRPATSPPASQGHAMAYDVARRRTVLFGGAGTWEWDGSTWLQRTPPVSPSLPIGVAMAYDAARQRVVVFGTNTVAETWEWDGTTWQQRGPSNSPTARTGHAMAYDAARQRVVLFGGWDSVATFFGDTWEWDGSNWLPQNPPNRPSARFWHAMTYDDARQRVVLFGGVGIPDTWEWDGANWTRRSPATSAPPHYAPALVYEAASQRSVLFGHEGTWAWDGGTWVELSSTQIPPARWGHAMASDPLRRRVVLFGGGAAGGLLALDDTWEWDGAHWLQQRPPVKPSARSLHAMAHDAVRQRVILFGGFLFSPSFTTFFNDTWEWDGTNWTQRNPATSPAPRRGHAMACDTLRQRVVMYGGSENTRVFTDTWEWDGTNWTHRTPSVGPLGGTGYAMAYDDARQRIVMFGGQQETWEWDGTNWTQRTPAIRPPLTSSALAMAYSPTRQRILLTGGNTLGMTESWEWDGTNWARRVPTALPPALSGQAMAFDDASQRVLLNGGQVSFSGAVDDTWVEGSSTAAASTLVGAACGGTGGLTMITSGPPAIGNTDFVLELLSARAASLCFFGISASTQSLQLGGGCTLYLQGPLVPLVTFTNASGFASVKLAIPLDPTLRGGSFHAQGFVSDPLGGFANLAFSAGLKLTFGD